MTKVAGNQTRRNQFLEQRESDVQMLKGQDGLVSRKINCPKIALNQEQTLASQQAIMQQKEPRYRRMARELASMFAGENRRQGTHEQAFFGIA